MTQPVYLKANFVAEPLIDQWYAWAHLVSPATAAMNIKNRHVSIMKSYVMAPAAHASAIKNPAMRGGPFIDYGGKRVPEIKGLLANTREENGDLLEFANAIESLNTLLQKEATGFSMHALYEKMPDILKGYVELVYDLNHQPSFRLKEALLYKSSLYKKSIQSLAMFLIDTDDRPFVFSTPRLADENKLHLNIPFDHPGIDALYQMQREAQSYDYIKDLLNITPEQETIFKTFFTTDAPQPFTKYDGDLIRTRYFGHACILIETKDINILVDPVVSYGYDAEVSRLTFKDLPDVIDYVVITHNHQDHILIETMLQLRHKVKHIIVPQNNGGTLQDPSLKLMLTHTGFTNIIAIDELDEVAIPNGNIIGLPFYGEHGDLDVKSKLGYFITIHNHRVLCLADSNNIEPKMYEHIQAIYGDVDVLFLGMECDGAPISWLYGPYLTTKLEREKDQSRRLSGSDYTRGIDIVNRFHCKEVYVYAMGQEPWVNYITSVKYTDESTPIVQSNYLVADCHKQGIVAERLFGEKVLLADKTTVKKG